MRHRKQETRHQKQDKVLFTKFLQFQKDRFVLSYYLIKMLLDITIKSGFFNGW
jgi:hypothetical protein